MSYRGMQTISDPFDRNEVNVFKKDLIADLWMCCVWESCLTPHRSREDIVRMLKLAGDGVERQTNHSLSNSFGISHRSIQMICYSSHTVIVYSHSFDSGVKFDDWFQFIYQKSVSVFTSSIFCFCSASPLRYLYRLLALKNKQRSVFFNLFIKKTVAGVRVI